MSDSDLFMAGMAAVIPAAGRGSRMGAAMPKQYLVVAGRTIIEHSLAALMALPGLRRIYVAVAADDSRFAELAIARDPRIVVVTGGEARADSVAAALARLIGDGYSWALVHDAARPCLEPSDLLRLVDDCATHRRGALLACAVRDTMKRSDGTHQVTATVPRELLWHALTPQLFPAADLARAIQDAQQAGVAVTDEASAMEWAGHRVGLVTGSRWNQKITEPDDLPLAQAWLSGAFKEMQ